MSFSQRIERPTDTPVGSVAVTDDVINPQAAARTSCGLLQLRVPELAAEGIARVPQRRYPVANIKGLD